MGTVLCLLGIRLTNLDAADTDTAAKLIEQSQVKGGLVVHLGCGSGELTRTLRINSRFQVHGLDRAAERSTRRGRCCWQQESMGRSPPVAWPVTNCPWSTVSSTCWLSTSHWGSSAAR